MDMSGKELFVLLNFTFGPFFIVVEDIVEVGEVNMRNIFPLVFFCFDAY